MFKTVKGFLLLGKLSKEKRRDTFGREVKVSPFHSSSTPDSVDEYVSSLKIAKISMNERRKSAATISDEDDDEEMDLLKIRDNPTRARRLSSRTPKFQPIQELRMESPPVHFKSR